MPRVVSWNVNGLRAIDKKDGLNACVSDLKPDILCLQEIRCTTEQAKAILQKFENVFPYIYVNACGSKKGYSGTAILSKVEAVHVETSFKDLVPCNDEGRIQVANFGTYHIINCYVPNSGSNRHELRTTDWDSGFATIVASFNDGPLLLVGDLNVAHEPIDVHSPSSCKNAAGFTIEERTNFDKMLLNHCKLLDSFRCFHTTDVKYSWWSNIGACRKSNKGWRIDYVLTNDKVTLEESDIAVEVMGSDHAPVFATFHVNEQSCPMKAVRAETSGTSPLPFKMSVGTSV